MARPPATAARSEDQAWLLGNYDGRAEWLNRWQPRLDTVAGLVIRAAEGWALGIRGDAA